MLALWMKSGEEKATRSCFKNNLNIPFSFCLEGITISLPNNMKYWNKKEVNNLELKVEKDTLLVYPQGDLDLVQAKKLREQVDQLLYSRGNIQKLVVNLNAVNFIDSSGLGVLIGRYKIMQNRQGQMMLCGANDNVYRILEISGMKKLMPIVRADAQSNTRSEGNGKR